MHAGEQAENSSQKILCAAFEKVARNLNVRSSVEQKKLGWCYFLHFTSKRSENGNGTFVGVGNLGDNRHSFEDARFGSNLAEVAAVLFVSGFHFLCCVHGLQTQKTIPASGDGHCMQQLRPWR